MKPVKVIDDAIVEEITIAGPAARIFDVLTRPEELVKWWHMDGKFRAVRLESDLRPGGKWRMHVERPTGEVLTVAGEYRQIERPSLLVYTWIREQEDGVETVVHWDLDEKDGITTVRVTHSGLVTEALRKRNGGWPMILRLIQAYVAEAK